MQPQPPSPAPAQSAGVARARPAPAADRDPSPAPGESLIDRIKWTTLSRVVLITAVLVFAIAMDIGAGPQPVSRQPETVLYQLTTTFYLLSFFALLATHLLRASPHMPRLAMASIAIDVLLAQGLVAVTDGVHSVFLFAFPLAVLNSALLLYRAGAIVAATLSAVALTVMAGMQVGWLPWSLEPIRVAYLRALGPGQMLAPFEVGVQLLVQVSAVYATAFLSSHLVVELDKARLRSQLERRELASLRVRFSDVVSSLPDGLLTVSPSGLVSSINPAALAILGIGEADVTSLPLGQTLPELGLLQPGETVRELEIRRPRASTADQILACRVAPLHDPEGTAGLLVVLRDMTDTRAREVEHRNRERLAAIGTMAAAVAHEIRNPLASISGSVQMLQDSSALADVDRQLMGIVLRETGQLSNWIGEFLDFARPRPVHLARCDLGEIVNDTVEACRHDPRLAAGGIDLRAAVASGQSSDDAEFALDGDPARLRQIVWNLVLNAVQAVLAVETRVVAVGLRARDDALELCVDDSGRGVDEADVAHVFEPFYTTKGEGTGLGLATVKRHVLAHGGAVRVERSHLGGARFAVTLPRHGDASRGPDPATRNHTPEHSGATRS